MQNCVSSSGTNKPLLGCLTNRFCTRTSIVPCLQPFFCNRPQMNQEGSFIFPLYRKTFSVCLCQLLVHSVPQRNLSNEFCSYTHFLSNVKTIQGVSKVCSKRGVVRSCSLYRDILFKFRKYWSCSALISSSWYFKQILKMKRSLDKLTGHSRIVQN